MILHINTPLYKITQILAQIKNFQRNSNKLHRDSGIVAIATTPAACGGTGSFVKRSENWSRPHSFHRSRKANNNNKSG